MNDYELFREHFGTPEVAVYPGHPITLAWIITKVFPTFEEAFKTTEYNWAAALGSIDVPGAGGCVHNALHVLQMLQQGEPLETAFAFADDMWARTDTQKENDPKRWKEGQEQADKVKPLLRQRESWWSLQEASSSTNSVSQSQPSTPE